MERKERKFVIILGAVVVGGFVVATTFEESPSAQQQPARGWQAAALDPDGKMEKAMLKNCIATPGCNPTAPSAPPEQATINQGRLSQESSDAPAKAANTDNEGVVRYTNPADTEYCNRPAVLQYLYAAGAGLASGGVSIRNVTAGENICQSTDPTYCKPQPEPGKHICHVVLQLQNGTSVPGNFNIVVNPFAITFLSDEKRRADGM